MANSMGIRGFDYVEFYVGSAKMVAYWYAKSLGFDIKGYSGPETGNRKRASYFLQQNDIKIVVTSPLTNDDSMHDFLKLHGDGIKRFAYEVDDVEACFAKAKEKGAIVAQEPKCLADENGKVWEAAIRENEMDEWVSYYNKIFDFETFVEFKSGDISTKYSALLSKVVRSSDNVIKQPVNEPHEGLKKSQIQEYIEEYRGSGVQHVAIACENILHAIETLRENGVEFLEAPDTYYDMLKERNLPIKENIDDLKKLGILCDFEGEGYLLQLFTKPIGDRPTFFFEIIQRQGKSEGFGKGNFQALFESIEKDQERRGNL